MDFNLTISIEVSGLLPNGTDVIQNIVPAAIGIPGCAWSSHQYDGYGAGGRYPVFVLPPNPNSYPGSTVINVQSTAVHRYTLGDFFSVWGKPLDPSNMFGLTTPPPPNNPKFNSTWYWGLCTRYSYSSPTPVLSNWGNVTLSRGLRIILFYSSVGCA